MEKKVLIVGGNAGIGLSLAKSLGAQGAEVIIASRSALEHKDKLQSLPGLEQCRCFSVDITIESEIDMLLQQVGNIDHLVITVKSPLVIAPFLALDSKDVHDAFNTKFWGQYNFAKLAHRYIRPDGSIIFTSGTLANRPHQGFSTMSIISGAVESLCKALAIEFAPIRVNSVCPGFKALKEMEDKVPLGLGSDSQMANPYLFLINDSYTTGTTIVTDGGAILV